MALHDILRDQPIVVFDLETTGISVASDRIVQIAALRIEPDGRESSLACLVNPEMPIPAEATAVHGITDEDVREQPTFRERATEVARFFGLAHLAGFNIKRFDVPLLMEEFHRAGVPFTCQGRQLIDGLQIFHAYERRDLAAALRFYCGEEHEDAHDATADVQATFRVLAAQLERYDDLPSDVDELGRRFDPDRESRVTLDGKIVWDGDEATIGFGKKHMGHPLRDVVKRDRPFLEWMLESDFSAETKQVVRAALAGKLPVRRK